jgi:hypothetical protein
MARLACVVGPRFLTIGGDLHVRLNREPRRAVRHRTVLAGWRPGGPDLDVSANRQTVEARVDMSMVPPTVQDNHGRSRRPFEFFGSRLDR